MNPQTRLAMLAALSLGGLMGLWLRMRKPMSLGRRCGMSESKPRSTSVVGDDDEILSFVANELQIIRAARFKHAQRSTNG
jgi:hypothetical protein